MLSNMDESFLITEAWEVIRNRISKNIFRKEANEDLGDKYFND